MIVLVLCEESQAVCKAFRALGHEAYSNDLLPCSGGHPEWHLQMDAFDAYAKILPDMAICFPECTHIAVSGSRHFAKKIADGRQQKGIDFFMRFTKLDCKWAIENPIGIMSTHYRKPDQIIQPYQFGHPSKKSTCLWLNGLSLLVPTNIVEPKIITLANGKKFSEDYMKNVKRSKAGESSVARSKTYSGIAEAMASQWSHPLSTH